MVDLVHEVPKPGFLNAYWGELYGGAAAGIQNNVWKNVRFSNFSELFQECMDEVNITVELMSVPGCSTSASRIQHEEQCGASRPSRNSHRSK